LGCHWKGIYDLKETSLLLSCDNQELFKTN
jgi:hypothetical protein